jgi:type 2 lantibiotic biosynthesis protein LanM
MPLRTIEVLDRTCYGWVEHVEHAACISEEEIRDYYSRAGILLCIAYCLNGTDFHSENIIASGTHPVLVDLEMLLSHDVMNLGDLNSRKGAKALLAANKQIATSVLGTGLLPGCTDGFEAVARLDVSGLGGVDDQSIPRLVRKWESINTDQMVLRRDVGRYKATKNVVKIGGRVARVEDYRAELVQGFQQMYKLMLEQRAALLSVCGPLRELANQSVRYVQRPTRVYAALQSSLLNPRHLRDGVSRGFQIDLLARDLIIETDRPTTWGLLALEKRAIEQGDIPVFTARANDTSLLLPSGEMIAHFFQTAAFDLVTSRLLALSQEDLECQVGFLEGSLRVLEPSSVNVKEGGVPQASGLPPVSMSEAEIEAEAATLAHEICSKAIRAPDASVAWIGAQYAADVGQIQFRSLGYDLYDGVSGVCLFLATAADITQRDEFRGTALGALEPLRGLLATNACELVDSIGIGGGSGVGGVIYCLLRISQLLRTPGTLDDACVAAKLITRNRLAGDLCFDVMDGAAGAILGLVALYELTFDRSILERALFCGEHLLSRQTGTVGYRAWPNRLGVSLTGFSHGAGGIAYGLLRLFWHTNDERFLEAAREAIAYEDSVLVRAVGNWPDLSAKDGPKYLMQWCHGAPGIGLARLGGGSILNEEQVVSAVEVALTSTERFGVGETDHLCCGNFGRIDFLVTAGQRLARPELFESAQRQVAVVVARAAARGGFALDPLVPRSVFSPGLLLGISGIGYELFRLAYPSRVPSVLLWENK